MKQLQPCVGLKPLVLIGRGRERLATFSSLASGVLLIAIRIVKRGGFKPAPSNFGQAYLLQLGEQPCRQGGGGLSPSQAEQQISGSLLATAGFTALPMLRAARNINMTTNSKSFRALIFTDGLDMIFSPLISNTSLFG
jgi:hypothetical protein